MKFTCSQDEISYALNIVQRAINTNNTLPVLNNILIKAEGKKVLLYGTNLEISINSSVDAKIENEGSLTVPAKFLTSYVSLVGKENLEFSISSANTLKLKSSGSEIEIKGISSDEFPSIPKTEESITFNLPVKKLLEAIDLVSFSASNNISRPVLTGVYMSISGKKVKMASTDSYRLSEKTFETEDDTGVNESFIVPSRTAQELAKILSSSEDKNLELRLSKGRVVFKVGAFELISRLIDGNFPDYEKIIPVSAKASLDLPCNEFLLGIKKVALVVEESNNNLRLKIESGRMCLYSEETQLGKGSVEFPIKYEGETMETALNAQYLLDLLSHLNSENINFSLNDGLSPVKIASEKVSGYTHIIMPLKV